MKDSTTPFAIHDAFRDHNRQCPRSPRCLRFLLLTLVTLMVAATAARAQFTDIGATLMGVHHNSVLWANYNGDGLLDLLLSGETPSLSAYSDLYKNNGGGVFTIDASGIAPITGSVGRSLSAWGDFDGDDDLDLAVTGLSSTGTPVTRIYRNNGSSFSLVTVVPTALPGVSFGSVAWGDFDNDGDLDLFVEGMITPGNNLTTVFRNDGGTGTTWTFTDINPAFAKVSWGDGAWGDYDSDGDMDLLVTGDKGIGAFPMTKLYRNDGGVFTDSHITGLPDIGRSSVAWGDFDNDGRLDVAIGGVGVSGHPSLTVLHNSSGVGFTLATTIPGGIQDGSVAWGDYNNDGKLDLLVTGQNISSTPTADLYTGDGLGGFTPDPLAALTAIGEGQGSWGDYDNDGRLDILLAGLPAAGGAVSAIYHNEYSVAANSPPSTPIGLTATSVSWHSISVAWSPSVDGQSQQATLSYNLSVKNISTGVYVMSPMANLGTGLRWCPSRGNTDHRSNWTITGLAPGTSYEVCVQAIDQGFASSSFACITVTTPLTGPDVIIRDCISDVGAEPNGACATYYESPDIYVRNAQDGLIPGNDVHQQPLGDATNWVYVKVKNIGAVQSTGGTVYLYFTKASTGAGWSSDWVNNFVGVVPYGDLVGSATVANLAPGAGSIVEIPWQHVPDPSDYGDPDARHFCLVARFVAAFDPMTLPEGIFIATNVQNNNNIAWKNVSIIDVDGPTALIDINNFHDNAITSMLTFAALTEKRGDSVLHHVSITLDLGNELFRLWKDGGLQGAGISPMSTDTGNTAIRIDAPYAYIDGLRLAAHQRLTLHVHVKFPDKFDSVAAGHVYRWNIEQFEKNSGAPELFGGEAYSIRMPLPKGTGNTGNGDRLSQVLRMDLHPNPMRSGTSIEYSLPSDGRIRLAIYDVDGRLVRELFVDADQAAGGHLVSWNGCFADGMSAPNGAYICRLRTPFGVVERRITIVR